MMFEPPWGVVAQDGQKDIEFRVNDALVGFPQTIDQRNQMRFPNDGITVIP
jgi:hypothetical protein